MCAGCWWHYQITLWDCWRKFRIKILLVFFSEENRMHTFSRIIVPLTQAASCSIKPRKPLKPSEWNDYHKNLFQSPPTSITPKRAVTTPHHRFDKASWDSISFSGYPRVSCLGIFIDDNTCWLRLWAPKFPRSNGTRHAEGDTVSPCH